MSWNVQSQSGPGRTTISMVGVSDPASRSDRNDSSVPGTTLQRRADLAQQTGATAVAHVLELDEDAIGIGEVQLSCPVLRSASILHPHADVIPQRGHGPALILSWFESDALQCEHRAVDIEARGREADVVD